MFDYLIRYVRAYCYNFWLGSDLFVTNTPSLYKDMLDYIDSNSSILEIGVGSGIPIIRNEKKIIRKNIQIYGIDIDEQYVNTCKENIPQSLLKFFNVETKDLFLIPESNKYDYIIYSESFPVIPLSVMQNMIIHSKKLLNPNGKIVFIHNLVQYENQKNHFIARIKPYIKYIPFVWVDFGRVTSINEFENWLKIMNLSNFQKEVLISKKIPIILGNYSIDQYVYVCKSS